RVREFAVNENPQCLEHPSHRTEQLPAFRRRAGRAIDPHRSSAVNKLTQFFRPLNRLRLSGFGDGGCNYIGSWLVAEIAEARRELFDRERVEQIRGGPS